MNSCLLGSSWATLPLTNRELFDDSLNEAQGSTSTYQNPKNNKNIVSDPIPSSDARLSVAVDVFESESAEMDSAQLDAELGREDLQEVLQEQAVHGSPNSVHGMPVVAGTSRCLPKSPYKIPKCKQRLVPLAGTNRCLRFGFLITISIKFRNASNDWYH